jgi:hypothetical protein
VELVRPFASFDSDCRYGIESMRKRGIDSDEGRSEKGESEGN